MLSRSALKAFDKGYRVVGSEVIGTRGRSLVINYKRSPYPTFNIWYDGKSITIKVHQLVAWQKFGRQCIGKEVVVRHKNDDESNFEEYNIELGTMEENFQDMHRNRKIKKEKEEPW